MFLLFSFPEVSRAICVKYKKQNKNNSIGSVYWLLIILFYYNIDMFSMTDLKMNL